MNTSTGGYDQTDRVPEQVDNFLMMVENDPEIEDIQKELDQFKIQEEEKSANNSTPVSIREEYKNFEASKNPSTEMDKIVEEPQIE